MTSKKGNHLCSGERCAICHPEKPPPTTRAEIEVLRQKISDLLIQKPDKAAVILTAWLNGPSKSKSTKKKVA